MRKGKLAGRELSTLCLGISSAATDACKAKETVGFSAAPSLWGGTINKEPSSNGSCVKVPFRVAKA